MDPIGTSTGAPSACARALGLREDKNGIAAAPTPARAAGEHDKSHPHHLGLLAGWATESKPGRADENGFALGLEYEYKGSSALTPALAGARESHISVTIVCTYVLSLYA